MTKMIKTEDGSYVLRSEIVCARARKKPNRGSEIITSDGKKYVVAFVGASYIRMEGSLTKVFSSIQMLRNLSSRVLRSLGSRVS